MSRSSLNHVKVQGQQGPFRAAIHVDKDSAI